MLTIGDLSRQTGVKVPTIRYYEQMGLLSHAERSEGNQRRYSGEERDRQVGEAECAGSVGRCGGVGTGRSAPAGRADRASRRRDR